jgi:hypothetical protein
MMGRGGARAEVSRDYTPSPKKPLAPTAGSSKLANYSLRFTAGSLSASIRST